MASGLSIQNDWRHTVSRSCPGGGVVVAIAIVAIGNGYSEVERDGTHGRSKHIRLVPKRRDTFRKDIHPESRNRQGTIVSVRGKEGKRQCVSWRSPFQNKVDGS